MTDAAPHAGAPADSQQHRPGADPINLDRIEADLAGVDHALRRLDDGTYFTDEVTGEQLPSDLLERDPTARRVPTA